MHKEYTLHYSTEQVTLIFPTLGRLFQKSYQKDLNEYCLISSPLLSTQLQALAQVPQDCL